MERTQIRIKPAGAYSGVPAEVRAEEIIVRMLMETKIEPMELADIFDRTFTLFGRSFVRNLIVTLIFLGVPALILIVNAHYFFQSAATINQHAQTGGDSSLEDGLRMLLRMVGVMVAGIIFFMGYAGATIGVTSIVWGEFSATTMPWKEAIRRGWSVRLVRAIGQTMIVWLVMAGCVCVPVLLISFGSSTQLTSLIILGVLSIFVMIGFFIRYVILWSMSWTIIATGELGVTDAMTQSNALIDGQWWRVFGILFLLGVITQFAISIISTPVMFATMWSSYAEYFKTLSATKGAEQPQLSADLASSMGLGIGLSISLSLILITLIQPVYHTVLYFDLRARSPEFNRPSIPLGELSIPSTDGAQSPPATGENPPPVVPGPDPIL